MKWKPNKLVKDTSALTLGMGLRGISQGIVFIIIARTMGVDGYGAFISVLALASTLAGFIGFGSHVLLTREIALNNRQFNKAWGRTLINLGLSIPIIFFIYLLLSFFFFNNTIEWKIILIIGFAELIFWPLSNICIFAFQGFEKMRQASRLIFVPILIRLFFSLIFLSIVFHVDIKDIMFLWAVLYLLAIILASMYSQYYVFRELGLPNFTTYTQVTMRLKESIPFSFWSVSNKLYSDADKIILTKMTTLDTTGMYSAAHRLIDLSTIPILGLIEATTPKMFKAGNTGVKQGVLYLSKIIKIPLLYAGGVSFAIYYLANFLPIVIGTQYKDSIVIIKYMSLMPLLVLPKIFLQHILATSGYQKEGMWIIILGAIINIIGNLIMIPIWGWLGAVLSTYVAEIIISISLLFQLNKIYKKE